MVKRKILVTILTSALVFGALETNTSFLKRESHRIIENANFLLDNYLSIKEEVNYWAVIIAIGDYKGDDIDILPPDANLSCLYTSLLTTKNWNRDHIKLLVNENATRDTILYALEWLKENADSNDIILFSYQGHGYELNKRVGIVPWEGLNGFITVDELDEKFDEINAKGMCLIFDCCLSGSFVSQKNYGYVFTDVFQKKFSSGIEGKGRVILMSTMPNGLGFALHITINDKVIFSAFPFTWLISKGIKEGVDINKDGMTSAEEAFYFAKIRILPLAVLLLNPIWQLKIILLTGHPILAFPQIYDGYDGPLPIVIK